MKAIGSLLIIAGLIWGFVAFNIDTSIEIGGESYGSGEYSVSIPKRRINNLGLMNEKQNNIYGAGITLVIGVILFIFGARKEDETKLEIHNKKEVIETVIQDDKDRFKISFPIKDKNSWNNIKTNLLLFYKKYNIENIISDNDTSWMIGGNEGVKGYIQATLNGDIIIIESFKLPKPDTSIIDRETKQKDEKIINSENTSTDRLIELGKLFKQGLVTKEEFDKEKKKILAS